MASFSFWKRKNTSGKSLGQCWLTLKSSDSFIDIYEDVWNIFYKRIILNGSSFSFLNAIGSVRWIYSFGGDTCFPLLSLNTSAVDFRSWNGDVILSVEFQL